MNTLDEIALDIQTKALIILAAENVPPDVQEFLVKGDPMRGVRPGVLLRLVLAMSRQIRRGTA